MIKIAIADDHKLFREGLFMLLSKNEAYALVGSYSNGKELIHSLNPDNLPDVILLDISMPEMDGLEVLKYLKRNHPSIHTIAISMHEDGNYVVKCVRSGAKGYLIKNADEEELELAIATVMSGKKYFNSNISELMINNMSLDTVTNQRLSPKEVEILKYISEGLTTKEVADKLYISTRTVETHRANMLKKLEVKNTPELIKKAAKLHLI